MTRMNTDLLPKEGLILCAVSGGADSMYLLCRLAELGYPVAAAHFNHGLRGPEADRDEAFVENFCRENGIPFTAGRGDVAACAGARRIGTEDAARRMRYDFLAEAAARLGAAVIATAHTADDNAETVLLRLTRGAGLRGLGGIPPKRGNIVRPMLDITRREVEEYLARRGIPHVEDATNAADSYARNRLRHDVLPLLERENPAFVRTVGRTAALLRKDEEYLSGLAADFLRENAGNGALPADKLLALPEPVAARAVRQMAGTELSAGHVAAVLGIAEKGGAADINGMRTARFGGRLYFGVETPPPIRARTLTPEGETPVPEAGLLVRWEKIQECPPYVYKSFNIFYFKCENICGNIAITARRPGDRLRPAGRGCTKTLKALFGEKGVPPWARESVPVLRDEAGVLGVYGVAAGERAAPAAGDGNVIKIEFIPTE